MSDGIVGTCAVILAAGVAARVCTPRDCVAPCVGQSAAAAAIPSAIKYRARDTWWHQRFFLGVGLVGVDDADFFARFACLADVVLVADFASLVLVLACVFGWAPRDAFPTGRGCVVSGRTTTGGVCVATGGVATEFVATGPATAGRVAVGCDPAGADDEGRVGSVPFAFGSNSASGSDAARSMSAIRD